ncbi:MAG: hypothetical protein IKY89_05485 [Alistipes sp.]|nr:hypothetical protein [Alistipes sp.]
MIFGRRSRKDIEFENQVLKGQNEAMYRELKKLAELPACYDCAKKFTHTCTCPPGDKYPSRHNCPHYTKAVIGR